MKYFITGTGTDIGKTHIARLLCDQNGWEAIKPVQAGGNDGEVLGCAPLYALKAALSPDMAAKAEGVTIDFDKVVEYCRQSNAQLIEGAGGVMSPIATGKLNLDLIKELDIPVILVGGSYLGSISHMLTALKALNGMHVHLIINESENGVPLSLIADAIMQYSGYAAQLVTRGGHSVLKF